MSKQPLPKPPLNLDKVASDKLAIYAIIDCAHFEEDFYPSVMQNTMLMAESLFMDTPDEESAVAGPLLVRIDPDKNKSFIEKLQQIEQEKPAVVWLWTEQNFNRLANNILKPLQYGELDDGKKILLRYYDPRCLEGLLTMFKEDKNSIKKLENIQAWAYKKEGQYHYLT